MKISQFLINAGDSVMSCASVLENGRPDLVLVFGSKIFFSQPTFFSQLTQELPAETLVGCSTAGEIMGIEVSDQTCSITALCFDHTPVRICQSPIASNADSYAAGQRLGEQLIGDHQGEHLAAVLLFGRGTAVNGSDLINGIKNTTREDLPISGGLAGDDAEFKQTYTLSPQGVSSDTVVAVGLYGHNLNMAYGSAGGWEPFGPTRRITSCNGNVLYTLDDEPALDIYKRYLGDYAKDLPSSGLLFPFEMLSEKEQSVGLIRTILGIDEDAGSLILAGSVEQNGYLRLMHSNTDKLIDGAEYAATLTGKTDATFTAPTLGLLVSCIGRKLVMGDRVDEEIEAVNDLLSARLGSPPVLTGFYSYGEINPHGSESTCNLHNQTMTIALLSEIPAYPPRA